MSIYLYTQNEDEKYKEIQILMEGLFKILTYFTVQLFHKLLFFVVRRILRSFGKYHLH
jgi:hypothetical protein